MSARPRREIAFRAISVLIGLAIPLGISEGLAAWLIARDNARWKAELPEAVRASVNLEDRQIPTRPDPYLGYRVRPNSHSGSIPSWMRSKGPSRK